MKKLLFGLLFLCGTAFANQFDLNNFTGGIRNDIDSSQIGNNQVADSENVLFDTDATGKTRTGLVKSNSTPLGSADNRNVYSQFEYRRSDGSSYHIAHSSTSLYSSLGSSVFTIFDSSVSASFNMNYAVFMDTLCYVNSEIGIKAWNTSSTFTHTTAYDPKYITSWQNRLCIAGDTTEPSNVILSAFQDPSNWTLDTELATGAVVFSINSQDGQNVTGFFLSPNGNLGILKEKSVWEIGGYDSTDFYQRLLIPDLGCVDSGSVGYKDGKVLWLSAEGWVAYDGKSYGVVSDNIYSTLENVQQLNTFSGSYSKNTTADWDQFTSTKSVSVGIAKLDFDPVISTTTNVGTFLQALKHGNTYYVASDSGLETMYYNESTSLLGSTSFYFGFSPGAEYLSNGGFKFNSDKLNISYVKYVSGDYSYRVYVATKSIANLNSFARSQVQVYDWSANVKTYLPGLITPHYASLSFTSGNVPYVLYKYHDTIINYTWNPSEDIKDYCTNITISSYTATSNTWSHTDRILRNVSTISTSDYWWGGAIGSNSAKLVIDANANAGHFVAESGDVYKHHTGTKMMYTRRGYVYYGSFTPGNSITITTETITSVSYTTNEAWVKYSEPVHYYYSVSIATNSAGVPLVTYFDATDMYVKFADRTTGSWVISNVYLVGGHIVEEMKLDIFVDKDDVIYITRNYYNGTYHGCRTYVKRAGQDWTSFVTDSQDARVYTVAQGTDRPFAAYIKPSTNTKNLIRESTGYYVSEIHNTGTDDGTINSITVNSYTNMANIYHRIRSSDTAVKILSTAWTTVTPNTSMSESLYRYLQYKVEFATDTLTNLADPSYVNSTIINYSSLSGNKRLSTMFYDGRLWLGVSISSTTCLDKTLVYDRNSAWTKFSFNQNVMNYLNLNGTPFMGANDGYIYRLDVGNNDDGKAINAYILTKNYDFENLIMEKSMDHLFVTALKGGQGIFRAWDMSISYYINRLLTPTETFAVNLDVTGMVNYKIPLTKRPKFFTIQYKIYNGRENQPFSFMGLHPILRSYPLR